MKIVCVGSYCAGAIITDILNGTKSPFEVSVVQNRFNHILKVPLEHEWNNDVKIPWLLLPLHEKEWLHLTTTLIQRPWTVGKWFAHHQPCHLIPNLEIFEDVLNITTVTMKSRWLRFLRHYYIEINGQKMIQDYALDEIKGMINIVKHDPSWLPIGGLSRQRKIENVEFEDIVSGQWCEEIGGDMDHMNAWQKRNDFLRDDYEHDPALIELWNNHQKVYTDPTSEGESWEGLTIERINNLIENG